MIAGLARPTDAELLRRLHDEHAAALWGFAVRLLGGDEAAAQDVVQETLLRAWQHPAVLDPETASIRGWLFTVARRIVIDQRRREHRRPEVVTARPPEPTAADPTEPLADRAVVLDALRTLSAEHRAVLLECYFRGASVAQAAATLGIAEGTVKSRTHYALRALRTALVEQGGWA